MTHLCVIVRHDVMILFSQFSGAIVHVKGINHNVQSAHGGDYWRLLLPGTYLVKVKDPSTRKVSPYKRVRVHRGHKATRLDFSI